MTQVTESGDKRSPFPRRASSRAVSLATSLPQGCFLLPAQDPGLAGEMPPGCLREVPHFLGDFTDRWEDTQVPWVFPHISLFSNKARWRGRIWGAPLALRPARGWSQLSRARPQRHAFGARTGETSRTGHSSAGWRVGMGQGQRGCGWPSLLVS